MLNAQQVADRVQMVRAANQQRDNINSKVRAIRNGDYNTVAPGLFNDSEFDEPLVANLIDTTARDIAEVMSPLPAFNCQSASLNSKNDQDRQDKREAIANSYVQHSRLQNQMFDGADFYGSYGFMAYMVEPDFDSQMPCIYVDNSLNAYYALDGLGRTIWYCSVAKVHVETLASRFPEHRDVLRNKFGFGSDQTVEVARWVDREGKQLVLLDPQVTLSSVRHRVENECPVYIVERPNKAIGGQPRGQFNDVIWVQVARALVQMYTMSAVEQSVHAPVVLPNDVQELEIGPFAAIQTDNPQGVGRVNLNISPGLFPEAQILAQEQRTGSRYPEGRSGSIDASIVTGQGVQALMGTFDTQVQTFQRLNASALEDVIAMCFKVDEAYWGNLKKTRRIKDNGAPRKFEYTPAKDIAGDYTVDVTYGAIAGLDPNRGLVFLLQALAGGLIAKSTARKHLPVDLNVVAEEREIQLEGVRDSIAAAISQLPLAIPQMVAGGMGDPRDLVLQIAELEERLQKGDDPAEAIKKVFAPKEQPAPEGQAAIDQAMEGGDPSALPGAGQGGASDMLMLLSGMTQGGSPNMQANVSRMQPI